MQNQIIQRGQNFFIDFSKAYNSLSHYFITNSFGVSNFRESLCRWIDILISDFYSVINHIFLALNLNFSNKLRCKHSDKGFQFNTGFNILKIYADNLTIFLQANKNSLDLLEIDMRSIIRSVSYFKKVSNLRVSLEKTSPCDYELTLCNDLGIKQEKEFKLLNIKNYLENSKNRMEEYIIEISKLLNYWKNGLLYLLILNGLIY